MKKPNVTSEEIDEALRLLRGGWGSWQAYCTFLFRICDRMGIDHNDLHCHFWARSLNGQPHCFRVAEKAWKSL